MTNELQQQIDGIIKEIWDLALVCEDKETAENHLKDLVKVLEAFGCDYTLKTEQEHDYVIWIDVEPKMSYDRKLFRISVGGRSLQAF